MSRKELERAVFEMISYSMEYNGISEFEIIEEIERTSTKDLLDYLYR